MMTKKLYWETPVQLSFSAKIVQLQSREDSILVELDQTAFYPLGGGQPADVGTIAGFEVKAVTIDQQGIIRHQVAKCENLSQGQTVNCEVDPIYRLEMTQQHTGQHILSQAFFRLFGAETCGFRIAEHYAEIDLAFDMNWDQPKNLIKEAESMANQIVFENRPIRSRVVSQDEAQQMPLRKDSRIEGELRIIDIQDYDLSPCGGTHAQSTGEVGLILVKSYERAKKMLRIQFVCGHRALRDYRSVNEMASASALSLGVRRDHLLPAVTNLLEGQKSLEKKIRTLGEITVLYEAQSLIKNAPRLGAWSLVHHRFVDRSLDELKALAHALIEQDSVLVVLGTVEGNMVRTVFARSEDISISMGELMKSFCTRTQGKGGGTPSFAQGACIAEQYEAAMAEVLTELTQ